MTVRDIIIFIYLFICELVSLFIEASICYTAQIYVILLLRVWTYEDIIKRYSGFKFV